MGVGFILYTFSNVFLFFRGKSIAANIFATLLDKVKIQKQKFSIHLSADAPTFCSQPWRQFRKQITFNTKSQPTCLAHLLIYVVAISSFL